MSLLFGRPETITKKEWDDRFKWNFDFKGNVNHAGYGPDRPYVPPLQNPSTIYGLQERHDLLMASGSVWALKDFLFVWALPFMIFIEGLGKGDTQDRYWYNNAYAEGE